MLKMKDEGQKKAEDQEVKVVDAHTGEEHTLQIRVEQNGIAIGSPGYGVKDGDYPPIYIEVLDGVLRILVWGDIQDEEPTNEISLVNAKIRVIP